MNTLRSKLGTFLLGIWLILTGLVVLLNLNIPSGDVLLAILAVVTGIIIVLDIREAPGKNMGRLVLSIWLILTGLMPLLNISFTASTTILAVLATAAGVLMLLGR